jgi:phosphoribosylglycinamide formyltransferase 2
MVTLASQDLSEFDLHARAILGLPVPQNIAARPAASAVILAERDSDSFAFTGLSDALALGDTDVRIFGKPTTRPYRRMGVALARAEDAASAVALARRAAAAVRIVYSREAD